MDILQDMAARHQSERTAMKKQTEDLKADLDARDKLLTTKTEWADKLAIKLEKLESLPPDQKARLRLEQEPAAAGRIKVACVRAEGELNAFLAEVADVLALDGVSVASATHAMASVRFLCESLADFVQTHNIDFDFEGMVRPEWLREQAVADLGVEEGR